MKAIIGIVLLGATYGFGSLAIDTGRWLFYFLTFVALIMAIKFGIAFFKQNGSK